MDGASRIATAVLVAALIAAVPVASAQTFSREELVEDVWQLADLIEDTHPDPYVNGGGKIAFHLRLLEVLEALPEEGMTRDEFIRVLRPFVAGVGDSHTEIWTSYVVDDLRPGGIPFRFGVVEDRLYVSAAARTADRDYVGSTLVSVERVPVAELVERQRRLVALENEYHVLEELCSHSLWYASYLRDLVPEWENAGEITFELRRPAGEIEALTIALPVVVRRLYGASTALSVPVPGASGFVYGFLDPPETRAGSPLEKAFAYLRVDHMTGYRELDEGAGRASSGPSATEAFRDLTIEMADSGTQTLVVDLRYDGGGDSLMSDILVYFLYGKEVLRDVFAHAPLAGGGMVVRLSEMYLDSPYTASLDELNERRDIPWRVGDYDFTRYIGASDIPFSELAPDEQRYYTDGQYCERTATFCAEYESGTYAGYYCPDNVLVLVSPWTFSSGLTMARHLYLAGATLVGTPSGQASNSFCNADRWVLGHTRIEGQVSRMYYAEFPDDPGLGKILPVHYALTYDRLASYGFDPNAELLYALAVAKAAR